MTLLLKKCYYFSKSAPCIILVVHRQIIIMGVNLFHKVTPFFLVYAFFK